MKVITAPVFRFGKDVDTDVIIPGQYLKLGYAEAAPYIMSGLRPGFSDLLGDGAIIVAGENFGCGSSREAAPAALKLAGVKALVAPYFARIFYRNAINVGLPALECPQIVDSGLEEGDWVSIDITAARIRRQKTGEEWSFSPLSPQLQEILLAGGLVPYLRRAGRDTKGD